MRREHHLPVSRTARYFTVGEPGAFVRELWFVCHGYGQLAGRFIRHFESLEASHRLIVAPEALSRFYVEVPGKTHADTHVGASWMTREDRLSDIEDYVEYLDALHAHVMSLMEGARPSFTLLGFSQGVATASRWLERTKVRVDRALLWGGMMPTDIDLAAAPALRAARITVVAGTADEHATPEMLAAQTTRLAASGISVEHVSFNGSHRIDREVLTRLAAEDAPAL
ncbi:MAG: phospholipase [Gemmatimonadaceae bacterium]